MARLTTSPRQPTPVLNEILTAPDYSFTQSSGPFAVPWASDYSGVDPNSVSCPTVRTVRISDKAGNVPDMVIQGIFQ